MPQERYKAKGNNVEEHKADSGMPKKENKNHVNNDLLKRTNKAAVEKKKKALGNKGKKIPTNKVELLKAAARKIADNRRKNPKIQRNFLHKNSSENDSSKSDDIKSEAKEAVKKKIFLKIKMFIMTHPWVIGVAVIFLVLLLIPFMVGFWSSGKDSKNSAVINSYNDSVGASGYQYANVDDVCKNITVTGTPNDNGTYPLEEYVAGVVSAEVGGFNDSVSYETMAIAARSYGLKNVNSNCEINGTAKRQVFRKTNNQQIIDAANNTKGLVLIEDDGFANSNYDALCWTKKDDSNYYLCQKHDKNDADGITVDKEWLENTGVKYTSSSFLDSPSKGNHHHGLGLSQIGTLYYSTVKNYSRENILNLFYGDNVSIKSIYRGVTSNYNDVTSTGYNDIINIPIRDFLDSKGTSVEAFNEYILKNVLEVGVGTRNAVVRVAVSTIATLYQNYSARFPYTFGGLHGKEGITDNNGNPLDRVATTFYGIHPKWGTPINYYSNNNTYINYGPDCSGFISWVLHNAGFKNSTMASGTLGSLGEKTLLDGKRRANPGDLIWHKGHIMLVVGVDDDTNDYYIAHASGKNKGVLIEKKPFEWDGNYAIDMEKWYNDENNKFDGSNEDFIKLFRSGYIDGYTGTSTPIDIPITPDPSNILLVGDSRTVGLCNTESLCNSNSECSTNTCLASVGKGYSWFKSEYVQNKIANSNKQLVVINMGANDIEPNIQESYIDLRVSKYYDLFQSISNSSPQKQLFIMSINPVADGASISNDDIIIFNNKMKNLITDGGNTKIKYLDAFNSPEISFNTVDKLHYTDETYQQIYNFIIREVSSHKNNNINGNYTIN